ncbi:MAG TPA: hypothetical protein ENJ09_15405 [Planctomycetes bacterium]|nr:hypothetical protein [Planctomycetota bacterium]
MIRRHDFNSDWYGDEAGIVADASFFAADAAARDRALAPFAFVEARGPLSAQFGVAARRAGFFLADTQIPFRIALAQLESSPSIAGLEAKSAAEEGFEVREPAPFVHERFALLPGVGEQELAGRYLLWSARLIAEHPETALAIRSERGVEGWFLSRRDEGGLELTLAMLAADATISGHHLYHRALLHYRDLGARVGRASFSVANSAVHNIYASLGARFLEPQGCWLWIRGG